MLEILRVGFQQAIRSIILLLLPTSFIALVVWATSGSATGNTADPIRAAIWSILVAHQVPLQLNSGYLTFLPLGALVIPYLAFFAYLTSGLVPRNAIQFPWQRALRSTIIVFAALLGLSFLVLTASLIWHFETVLTVTRVVEPGIFGGLTLALIQLFYLPNIAIATLSYLIGSGFEIGVNSLISPITYRIDELPAIPLLGAIPTSSAPIFLLAIVIPIAAGIFIARYGVESYSRPELDRYIFSALAFIFLISFAMARLSSGELLSANLKSTGPIWWAMPIAITAQIGLGSAIYLLSPRLIGAIRQLQSRHGQTS